jgi:hypothetical protein
VRFLFLLIIFSRDGMNVRSPYSTLITKFFFGQYALVSAQKKPERLRAPAFINTVPGKGSYTSDRTRERIAASGSETHLTPSSPFSFQFNETY